MMRDLMLWDRSSLTRSVFDEMEKAFNDVFGKDFFPTTITKSTYPKMNVYDDNGNLCIDAYVPEVSKEKLSVSVTDGVLTLSGDSDADRKIEDSKYYFRELSKRSFKRSIKLPESVNTESVSAECVGGVLKIKIPYLKKEEDKPKTRQINIA